jgi:hypothetical protein
VKVVRFFRDRSRCPWKLSEKWGGRIQHVIILRGSLSQRLEQPGIYPAISPDGAELRQFLKAEKKFYFFKNNSKVSQNPADNLPMDDAEYRNRLKILDFILPAFLPPEAKRVFVSSVGFIPTINSSNY